MVKCIQAKSLLLNGSNSNKLMKYSKKEAKEYAFQNMKGIWAAALNPFDEELSLDERGLRSNLRHWIDDLEIDGFFVTGKQGEFFSMSIEERKKSFLIAVDECFRVHHFPDFSAGKYCIHLPKLCASLVSTTDLLLGNSAKCVQSDLDVRSAISRTFC